MGQKSEVKTRSFEEINPEDLYPKSLVFRNAWQIHQLKSLKMMLSNNEKINTKEQIIDKIDDNIKILKEAQNYFEKKTSYRCILSNIIK